MSDPILAARGLRKTYSLGRRTLEVLRGIDLSVGTGEFVALRGASGAGKSTLLHLLGGLDRPDAGEIHACGQDLGRLSNTALTGFRNRHVGFIFQSFHLLPELDALENVMLPARMARTAHGEAVRLASDLLARVGLGDRTDHRPGELSGGEQQRVAVARALINQPELVLADEPTGNLDSATGNDIVRLLLDLRKERRMTLLIATHDADLAALADRQVHLVDGHLAP
jgi:ABC-type lipoprotein export system ATPase subunit